MLLNAEKPFPIILYHINVLHMVTPGIDTGHHMTTLSNYAAVFATISVPQVCLFYHSIHLCNLLR